MKVECLKKQVDLDKIHWAIKHYGDDPSYIVINHETRTAIIDNYYCDIAWLGSEKGIRKKEQLFGIPIALNEDLDFGEVDIV